jgi:carboxyl-terminal processing protease
MGLVDKNRAAYQRDYKNFEAFQPKFVVTEAMLSELIELLKAEDCELINTSDTKVIEVRKSSALNADDLAQFAKSKSLIKTQIKALVARDLWDMNEYFQIINEESEIFKKGVEIIQQPSEYDKLLH